MTSPLRFSWVFHSCIVLPVVQLLHATLVKKMALLNNDMKMSIYSKAQHELNSITVH